MIEWNMGRAALVAPEPGRSFGRAHPTPRQQAAPPAPRQVPAWPDPGQMTRTASKAVPPFLRPVPPAPAAPTWPAPGKAPAASPSPGSARAGLAAPKLAPTPARSATPPRGGFAAVQGAALGAADRLRHLLAGARGAQNGAS
ncbi:MAG: hypothetical protein LBT54_04600 [Bifidobacteriaceae bacterium]|nr:hypothetical protein [Bifidobacteriaceae bacterium]